MNSKIKRIQTNIRYIFYFTTLLFTFTITAQEHKIVLASKTKAYLLTDGKVTDSLITMNFYRKNQFMKVRDGKLYVFRAVVPGVDNLEGIYHKIEEYTAEGDKFQLVTSVPVIREIPVTLKLRLRKKGIMVSYPMGFLKRYKDIITYEQFAHTATYVIKRK